MKTRLYRTPIGTFNSHQDAYEALVRVDFDPNIEGMIVEELVDAPQYTDVYWIDGHKLSNPIRCF